MTFSRLDPEDRNIITENHGIIHFHGFRNLERRITVFAHDGIVLIFNTTDPTGMDFVIRDNKSEDDLLRYLLSDSFGYVFGCCDNVYFKTPLFLH